MKKMDSVEMCTALLIFLMVPLGGRADPMRPVDRYTAIYEQLDTIVPVDGLVSFWDFQETSGPFVSKIGRGKYVLEALKYQSREWTAAHVTRVHDAPPGQPFGQGSVSIEENQMLVVPETYDLAPMLNIHGDNATLTMVAWVKPDARYYGNQSARHGFGHVAGIWSEPISVRTYVMFSPQSGRGTLPGFPGVNHLDVEVAIHMIRLLLAL